jgi:MGT family glycosyltransferase
MPFAGHVAPITGVVAELVTRGHEVAVYTGARYLDHFEALGAQGLPWSQAPDFDEHDLRATFPGAGRPGPRGLLANLTEVFIRTGAGQARDLLAAHRAGPFTIIAGDVMSLGTGLAAELSGLPWATLSIVPPSLTTREGPPPSLALQPGTGRLGRLRDGLLRGVVRAAATPLDLALRAERARLGLPSGERFERALYSPQLVVATGSPSLDYGRSGLGRQFQFVGRLAPAGRRPGAPPDWWPELESARGPVVLITQGTFNRDPGELLAPALSALAELDALVLGTTAGMPMRGPIPANARLADRLDFAEVLPRTSVMVTNGGWGGVIEALSYGIPLIIAGGDLDKPEIAARVAWSGAGIDLRTGRPGIAAIRDAYDRITADPSYAEEARRIGAELRALGGTARAADLIEGLTVGVTSADDREGS